MTHDKPNPAPPGSPHRGVEYDTVSADYLQRRELKQGAAGWVLLASLGVSYVISGDFAGWNFGLVHGGFGGMLLAVVAMATMYLCLVFTLAELSTSLPTAGGGYSFARRAMGPLGGYLTGTAVLLEYAIAPAAIVIFIGSYVHELVGWDGPLVYAIFYIVFIGIHLWGAGEALKIMMGITLLAVVAIAVFVIASIPFFQFDHLFPSTASQVGDAVGASRFLPHGYYGIWAAIPFAMWLFLAVEGVPLAAEEAREPATDIPRGIITAMLILLVTGGLVLFLAPGAAGVDRIQDHGAPLVAALQANYGSQSRLATFVNFVGLSGLIASFFAIIYAYSRQVFALSRAGYLPRFLSITGHRKVPSLALIVPGLMGFLLSLTGAGDLMINMAVFGATISYAMISLSHILLRLREPQLPRPYKTPGGSWTSGAALILSLIAFASTFAVSVEAAFWTLACYGIMVSYFMLYSRHHLVAQAPEEEFAAIAAAETELSD
jgi:ethanolamine permease